MSSYNDIYNIVRKIPYGKVATYGQIAEMAGRPGQARLVGYALHNLTPGNDIPWHRVINSKGKISSFGAGESLNWQRALLENEGICFNQSGKLDLKKYLWRE